MLKITSTACIDAPVEKAWAVLSDLEKISDWSEEILSASCNGLIKKGLGAERDCLLKNNITIRERVTLWDEGNVFSYEGENIPLVKTAKNTWSVKSENGKTLLLTESEIVMKGGIFGRLLDPLMYVIAVKMSGKTLAAFKYLVENGRPYEGKYSRLPRVSSIC